MAQDVFSEMAVDPWLLNEDGYLNVNTDIKEIVYHPSLNIILISSKSGVVHVLDVNSGVILLSSNLAASNKDTIKCMYLVGPDRILFSDGETIGVRSDYNGVLLLDSILQKTIGETKNNVKLELPLSEAVILKQGLTAASISGIDDVVNELTEVILNAQKQSKKGIKAQKWNTVCLELPIDIFQSATSNAVSELLTKNLHKPELAIASAVHERLSELHGEQANVTDKKFMASESRRRETFSHWPHMDYKWALPDQMAQAGFYHQPNNSGDDRAMCFTCTVCLVCWERSDEPWSEHERHSPTCPFVMGEYTQNVPLSVTLATNPAIDATFRGSNVSILGSSNVPELLPVGYNDSLISVFNVSGKIQRTHSFYVTQFDSHILEKLNHDFGAPGLWRNDDKKYPIARKITALSIVGDSEKKVKTETDKDGNSIRPTIICGLHMNSIDNNLSSNNNTSSENSSDCKSNLYLVVYDFMYKKELDETEQDQQKVEVKAPISYTKNENPTDLACDLSHVIHLQQTIDETLDPDDFMKHLFSYKTLIPGDISAIHIPPPVTGKHSGPRVLPLNMQVSETDSVQSNSFTVPTFFNDSTLAENTDVSISDHIKELKNNKTQNKLNYSHAVQCISLPFQCRNLDLDVSHIIPTRNNQHVLIVVTSTIDYKSFLLLYELDFTKKMVRIKEKPILMRELEPSEKPIEVNLLPNLDKLKISRKNNLDTNIEGNVIIVSVDGAVRIIDLTTLKTVCYAKLESEKFLSATYCNSLERLCVSTKGGSLHFYALNETDNESMEDEDEDVFGLANENVAPPLQTGPDLNETKCFNEPVDTISLSEIKRLHGLCDFETYKSGYCAVVPPCWGEIFFSLRQRNIPMKLKTERDQYTKTWRLQTDTTTWDEHIFEISLPTSTCLGHVDVQFQLHPSTMPHVEVTLLKQNTNGIGHKKDVKFGVDESITIDMLQWVDNPVISQEYLRAHNAEILAGPINLAEHLDLVEQSATVTLTSPKLFRSKCRTFLLHIRAVYAKDEINKQTFEPKSFDSIISSLDINKLSQTSARKIDFYMGCDCIHELSLTIFTSKHTEMANERSQRNFMLESNVFIQSLFLTMNNSNSKETIRYILDILNWVAAIRLARNRSNNGDAPNHQVDFINCIQNNLNGLIYKCLLLGDRSIAHMCMKLVTICCSGADNINESIGEQFSNYVLNILLWMLDLIDDVKSAAGLQWIFALILKVTSKEDEVTLSNKLVEVLGKITEELHKRSNPYHLLLRSRYGLYGTPMEPELFDVELPSHIKSNTSSTYIIGSSNSGEANCSDFFANYSFNKESITAKDVLFNSETKLKYKNIAPPKIIKGLIETVPLHFACISASEGTRLERADASGSSVSTVFPMTYSQWNQSSKKEEIQSLINHLVEKEVDVYNTYGLMKRVGKTNSNSQEEAGHIAETLFENVAKAIENANISTTQEVAPTEASNLPWQQLLVTPPQQVIVVERMHSGARRYVVLDFGQPVLLTDVIIPSCSDLISISIDVWLAGEGVDDTRLVIALDIGSRNLLLNDLQPPPLCRYVKITTIGRYGMTTARCRIPIGYFYGHIIVLPEDLTPNPNVENSDVACKDLEKQLNILSNLLEDITCRYSLACSKLKDMLQPYISSDLKNAENLFNYINVMKDISVNSNNVEHGKIFSSYQDAINFQLQLNTVKNVMGRIEESLKRNPQNCFQGISNCSTDKLRAIAEGIIEVLLSIDAVTEIDSERCQQLFNGLCVSQTSRLQLLASLLLDKSCGRKPFWGNFLADTLHTMFSTSYTVKFPQDRLFVLMNFLSRRTPEKSSVLDAALRIVYETLKPAMEQDKTLLAISIDLPLLSWLLMYLSMQLDLAIQAQSSNRWNFVFGETVVLPQKDNSKNANRRKSFICKRAAATSSPIMSSSPTQPFISPKISHWKANGLFLKGAKLKLEIVKKQVNDACKEAVETACEKPKKVPQHINKMHCQIVARALLHFILAMDHSSSADMMLLSFKIVSRLVCIAKLQLGQLISEEQLLKLINICISSKMDWAIVALTCFLEDSMELTSSAFEDADMETINSASNSWFSKDMMNAVENLCDPFALEDNLIVDTIKMSSKPNTSNSANNINNFPPLPSVFESDDSEFEELLEDFDKMQRTIKKPVKTTFRSNLNISTAIDSRLELGVTATSEISIKKMLIKNTEILFHNISSGNVTDDNEVSLTPWSAMPASIVNENPVCTQKMLTNCFETLFENLQLQSPSNIEKVINFWLTVNNTDIIDSKFDSSVSPKIILKPESVKNLITALAWTSGLSLTTWCTSLQALCLVCNINLENPNSHWPDIPGMAAHIVDHPDFQQFLLRLLSGTGLTFSGKELAGPTLCKALHDFLVRLEMRCDIVSPTSNLGISVKNLLLKVVYQLIQPLGSITSRQGPLDAQCRLLQNMLHMNFTNTDLSIAMSIFESTGVFVQSYVENVEKIKCLNIGERQSVATSTFSDIFASVLGSDSNKSDRPVSHDILLINLLRLLSKLIETPVPSLQREQQTESMESSSNTSQTDESKAEQIHDGARASVVNTPCFADIILRHHPCIIRLCHALAACKSSSLCMLVNVSQKIPLPNLGEPVTVGDAVFQVLALLAKKSSSREALMEPLLIFLSQTPHLSEPLLWFIVQVIDTEEAVRCFFKLGGITIFAKSIVDSSNAPSTIAKMGMISTVMQHFSGSPVATSDSSYTLSSMSGPKKMAHANLENKLSLINFAPNCTVRCLSSTAQTADVLVQGLSSVTHRRARTPLWSYHFYPDETHTELLLQLPSAILLKEVQLQPHTIGLATCPSGVALEVSAAGPSRLVPVCTPIPTSGLTFIRLHLPTPKVVNCVLIRLYRPREANSIGLLQIRLLGTTAYGQNYNDASDDESHCKHSLGWLRLLHHCFSLPSDRDLQKQIIGCASNVPNLLNCCCGLLLVPSHILPAYMQCLEKILKELALYSSNNSFTAIKVLLNNKSSIIEPLQIQNGQERHLVNSTSDCSTCELLYQICEHQDEYTIYRIKMVLEWLKLRVNEALQIRTADHLNAVYIFCIASICWSANETRINYDIKSLISIDLFESIVSLRELKNINNNLKYSIDSLLCSMCYVNPEFYPKLLQKLGVTISSATTSNEASISDDLKDSMTDDHKCTDRYNPMFVEGLSKIPFAQLETIALVSRSSTAIQQLLDSGFPKLLNQSILEFASSSNDSIEDIDKIIVILKFFTNVCDEKKMRDWLGSADGSSFWLPFLNKLCKKPSENKSALPSEAHVQLEEICVKFLSKCCLCHQVNQIRLAKVLCEVIELQNNGMSGFLRRIILQLLLEYEKIPVYVSAEENLYKTIKVNQTWLPSHPGIKQSHNKVMLYLSTNTTIFEILEQHVYFNKTLKTDNFNKKLAQSNYKKGQFCTWYIDDSDLSMAAGVTAKDKRAKDLKNKITSSTPESKRKRYANPESTSADDSEGIGGRLIKCEALSEQPLSLTMNLSQLLKLIESKGNTTDWPCIHLSICQSKSVDEIISCASSSTSKQQSFGSALQVFSSIGGLALLAQHLPTVYPEAVRLPAEKTTVEQSDSEWIKVDGNPDCDDIYEDIEETIGTNPSSKGSSIISHIPSHSLTAFGLFLRLPGYSELLLKDMKRALCLLRLVLGVTDDGEGGDIFQSNIAETLPTLPFEILKKLYNATPLTTDDGMLLRRISINSGVVHLLLACISIFTHHSQEGNDKDDQKSSKEERTQLYWAKGTGFGTGSTQQSWNVEQALLKQRSEEEHVTVLLQVLASYINPSDKAGDLTKELLPPTFTELLANSTLLPALCSYLKNDSVFDMARHIPLYKAVLQLLRAIASSSQLVTLLLERKANGGPSLCSLLRNMKHCVDTYTSKLKINSTTVKSKSKIGEQIEESEQGEGLATLMPDIEETTNLVAKYTNCGSDSECERDDFSDKKIVISPEEKYIKIMKNMQFGSHEMIKELPEGGLKFVVSHHFESNARLTSEQSHPTRVKRIAQEAVTLSTSLPLSYSSSVFVRYDTSRLDVMKVLIIGPSDTPYANGCFELDVFFPPDYPSSPMMINLETTGHNNVRFNPNLYNDGKVCLSVLNTWHGRPEEKWNPQTSSFLQVLVSIQSLILVPEPYFNEPGYERARGTPAGTVSSKDYNLNICQATVRWAMLEQILNPCPCFKEIIHSHFYLKRDEIIRQVEQWVKELEEDVQKEKKNSRSTKKTPASTLDNFKQIFNHLKEQLNKLQPPSDGDTNVDKHSDADEDMEKMVNDMCE